MMLLSFALASILGSAPVLANVPCADKRLAAVARCGSVEVPENWDTGSGRSIRLNVIVLPATGPKKSSPPLFDLDGGPGLPATKNAEFYLTAGAAYRAERDIVLVDQRGTGGSNGLLCPELSKPEDAYRPMLPIEAVDACRRRLERVADLTRYGTREAVTDLDAVRRALGHERIDLFALSYGSTVALRYMATHSGRVRAAVLMGTAPPDTMPPRAHATAGQRALDLLFTDCAADAECKAAFPKLGADFSVAVAALGSGGDLTPEIFAEKVRSLMYSPTGARKVPFVISRAAAGDLQPFYAATASKEPLPYADGMFLSVTCSEGIALMDLDRASTLARGTRFGDYRIRRQRAACERWPIGQVAADHLTSFATDAAVLLISGRLDPVTPPEWADTIANKLPNSRHFIIPQSGHTVDGLSGVDTCLDPLVLSFLKDGILERLDPTCLKWMRPPPFQVAPAPGTARWRR